LPVWFDAVRQQQNPVIAAYLQTLLLTGARAGEVLGLKWDDINTEWRGMTIRDKVEGTRIIPLTPFVAQLLATLPKRNEWVFSSAVAAGGTIVPCVSTMSALKRGFWSRLLCSSWLVLKRANCAWWLVDSLHI